MSAMQSASTMKTFFVWQQALGSPLEFSPSLGTQELDDLIRAYIPGPASIQEKRALISLDFFEYAQMTGSTVKCYSVDVAAPMCKAPSSTGSSSMQDSGYGSSFVSPATSNWSWPSQSATPVSVAAQTPSFGAQDLAPPKARSKTSKRTMSRGPAYNEDFSHIPGMKIMTKDGRDVTNSASRGCKTKEQRDHAHLMRIIKACDTCRRKKIRCDPSHKKRSSAAQTSTRSSSSQSQSRSQPRTTRSAALSQKSRKPAFTAPEAQQPLEYTALTAPFPELDTLDVGAETANSAANHQDPWEAFLQYEEPYIGNLSDWDLLLDSVDNTSPSSTMSNSSTQSPTSTRPRQHAPQTELQSSAYNMSNAHASDLEAPNLPYLGGASGSNYVDFNLFSPATSFVDEESMPLIDVGTNLSGDLGISSFDTVDTGLLEELSMDAAVSQSPVTSSRDQQRSYSDTAYSELESWPVSVRPSWPTVQTPEGVEALSSHGITSDMRNAITPVATDCLATQAGTVVSDVGYHGQSYYRSSTTQDLTRLDQQNDAGARFAATADQSVRSRAAPVTHTEELNRPPHGHLRPIAQVGDIGTDVSFAAARTTSVHPNSMTATLSGIGDSTEPGPSWGEQSPQCMPAARSEQQQPILPGIYTVTQQQTRDARLSTRGTTPQAPSPGYPSAVASQAIMTGSHAVFTSDAGKPSGVSDFGSDYEALPSQYAAIATFALGAVTLAAPLSLHLMVCIVAHFTLGLMVVGAGFGPGTVCPKFFDQRSRGTKDQTQSDKPASAVSRHCRDNTSSINGLCRQIQKAHFTAAVGRLATHLLLAPTQ